jgi:hypothetical protein
LIAVASGGRPTITSLVTTPFLSIRRSKATALGPVSPGSGAGGRVQVALPSSAEMVGACCGARVQKSSSATDR